MIDDKSQLQCGTHLTPRTFLAPQSRKWDCVKECHRQSVGSGMGLEEEEEERIIGPAWRDASATPDRGCVMLRSHVARPTTHARAPPETVYMQKLSRKVRGHAVLSLESFSSSGNIQSLQFNSVGEDAFEVQPQLLKRKFPHLVVGTLIILFERKLVAEFCASLF